MAIWHFGDQTCNKMPASSGSFEDEKRKCYHKDVNEQAVDFFIWHIRIQGGNLIWSMHKKLDLEYVHTN